MRRIQACIRLLALALAARAPLGWKWDVRSRFLILGRSSLVFLALTGCSREEPPAEVSAASDADRVPEVREAANGGGTTETAGVWGDAIKLQLRQLADRLLNKGDFEDTEASLALAEEISMTDTRALQEEMLYQGQSVKVVALRLPDGAGSGAEVRAGADDFVLRLRELLCLLKADSESTAAFKLFGIHREGDYLKTKQRLMAKGRKAGNPVQSQAVVEATWVTPEEEGVPRLTGFSMSKVLQNELIAESLVAFEDIASGVLGENPAWGEQLEKGMNAWVRRIDRALKPDFLGYHGLAIRDVDGDGLEDLYLCQAGGLPNLLFKQQPDGTFVDISASAGVDWLDNSTGALLVDLDNDGDSDLVVATQQALIVMENDGAAQFSVRARLSEVGIGYSPTAADFDLDGDLDLLVLRYNASSREIGDFPTPHPFHSARNGGANVLLENQGDFRFSDVTEERGLGAENYRFSFAASWEDYDNDGDLDLYIANDFGPNQLWRNDSGNLVDVSVESGTQDWGFGMSASWADYDRDGRMDLYVSSMFSGAGNQVVPQADFNPTMPQETRGKYLKMVRGNTLMRNSGGGRFDDVTDPMAEGYAGWAWGSVFTDLNNDGWEDLYVANGYLSQPDTEDL